MRDQTPAHVLAEGRLLRAATTRKIRAQVRSGQRAPSVAGQLGSTWVEVTLVVRGTDIETTLEAMQPIIEALAVFRAHVLFIRARVAREDGKLHHEEVAGRFLHLDEDRNLDPRAYADTVNLRIVASPGTWVGLLRRDGAADAAEEVAS